MIISVSPFKEHYDNLFVILRVMSWMYNLVSVFKLPRLVPHKEKVIGKRYRLYFLHANIINFKNAWWKNEYMVYCFLKETSLEEKISIFLQKTY